MTNSEKAFDRLRGRVRDRGPVCVGLDTDPSLLPPGLLAKAESPAEAVYRYNEALIAATEDQAAVYKLQIAYYEALGLAGLRAYARTLALLRGRGLLAIADIKRGDIADTARAYARAHLAGELEADFVTLNPYMGMETLDPWIEAAAGRGKGLFVLVRTSNPGMRDFQNQRLADGRRLYESVADRIVGLVGEGKAEGLLGAVLGCTEKEEAEALRARLPGLSALIPGYGAQGGAAETAAILLGDGCSGVVNASRSILGAWKKSGEMREVSGVAEIEAAAQAARRAVLDMKAELMAASGRLASAGTANALEGRA